MAEGHGVGHVVAVRCWRGFRLVLVQRGFATAVYGIHVSAEEGESAVGLAVCCI